MHDVQRKAAFITGGASVIGHAPRRAESSAL
jgi:hypothetical protein